MLGKTAHNESQKEKSKEQKHPGRVNAYEYAAADSIFKARLWSLSASAISGLSFWLGLKNKNTAHIAVKAAEIVTWPEKFAKGLYTNITGNPTSPPDVKRNAPWTAALAIGFIVEYIAALPYFKKALTRITKINAVNDGVRAENVRLRNANARLSEELRSKEGIEANQSASISAESANESNSPASKIISGGKPASHTDAVVTEQGNPQLPISR